MPRQRPAQVVDDEGCSETRFRLKDEAKGERVLFDGRCLSNLELAGAGGGQVGTED